MNFQGIGAQGNYARAGKAAADDATRAFAYGRQNAPDYGKMAQDAANVRSKEKVAMNKIQSEMAARAVRVNADVKENQITLDGLESRNKGKRKAGVLAAGGKFIAQAGSYMGEKRELREVGADYDGMRSRIADLKQQADDFRSQADGISLTRDLPDADGVSEELDAVTPDKPDSQAPSTPSPSGTQQPSSNSSAPAGSFGEVYKMAQNSGAKYPELVAAQWALESDYGRSPSGKNNFFGLKALPGQGGTVKSTWEEDSSGNAYGTEAPFLNFDSPQASVDHLVKLWHKDYKGYTGANSSASAADAARYLRSQGYATDSKYADKLIDIMSRNGF